MRSELVIITPELARGSGGLADHTLALLEHWGALPDITLLVAKPTGAVAPTSANIQQLGTSQHDILKKLPPERGTIFLQYSAYGFDQFGYPRNLIKALIDWKTQTRGRLVLMFHEIWSFWPVTNKNFYVQQLHRRLVRRLLQTCDAVFTSTDSQGEHLRQLCNGVPIQVLCVGTNIRRHNPTPRQRDDGVAALFGLQLARIRTLESMQKSLAALAAAGRIKKLVCVGREADAETARRERELLNQLNFADGFVQQGPLSEPALSELLSSVRFGVFGQNELSCCKSGSFMAYAAHQLNVVAEFANPSKPPPVCWLVAPSELLGGIDESELHRRAECLRMWQEQNCSWDLIAGRLGEALGIEKCSAVTP